MTSAVRRIAHSICAVGRTLQTRSTILRLRTLPSLHQDSVGVTVALFARKSTNVTGYLYCDAPPDLALSAFASMPNFFELSNVSFSLFTGDIVSHDNDDQVRHTTPKSGGRSLTALAVESVRLLRGRSHLSDLQGTAWEYASLCYAWKPRLFPRSFQYAECNESKWLWKCYELELRTA